MDKNLLERFRDGDDSAFVQIYRQWFEPIFYLLRRLTVTEQDAEDIAQDVFGRLWEKRGTIDVERGVKSYLFAAARHSAIDLMRRNRRAGDYLSNTVFPDQERATSHDLAVAREVELLTELAIGRMPPQQRRVFELSYRDGLSPAQIAEQLEMAPGIVRVHIHNARSMLREMLPALILMLLFQ